MVEIEFEENKELTPTNGEVYEGEYLGKKSIFFCHGDTSIRLGVDGSIGSIGSIQFKNSGYTLTKKITDKVKIIVNE